MTHNSTVKTANLKPFKKGSDSRRNPTGALCKEAAAFSMKFRNALAKKITPDELADIIIDAANRRRPWAIDIILERLIGKVTQPITGEMDHNLFFDFRENGNGNGDKGKE